jgi:uncharacterized membrane-anchored protein
VQQLPVAHPDRFILAEEVHARPPLAFAIPGMASYIAVIVDSDQRDAELAHIAALCKQFGVSPPPTGATHLSTQLAGLTMKWERHGEFSSLTFILPQNGVEAINFATSPLEQLPAGWLSQMPGQTIAAVLACVRVATDDRWGPAATSFDQTALVGSSVLQGRATVITDFRLHPDACTRFVLLDHGLTPRQAGQTLQRLFEIEAYRMLSLLALPIARKLSPRILDLERSLSHLTDGIAREGGDDDHLLNELTRMAAEIETGLASSQYRFGACRAYFALVSNRIRELGEERLQGIPTISEFMSRRFDPAVATCNTVSQRLIDVSERVAQASGLLSTRVEIARERQNHRLLSSMDTRARMQLRLQQTVEGLSIAAIVYYLAGLVGYAAKGVKAMGVQLNADVVTGLSIPILALLVYYGIRRARNSFVEYDDPRRDRRN